MLVINCMNEEHRNNKTENEGIRVRKSTFEKYRGNSLYVMLKIIEESDVVVWLRLVTWQSLQRQAYDASSAQQLFDIRTEYMLRDSAHRFFSLRVLFCN